jgi:Transmembrane secretion effector
MGLSPFVSPQAIPCRNRADTNSAPNFDAIVCFPVLSITRRGSTDEADGQGHRSGERSDRQDAIAKLAGERRRDGAFDWGVFEDTEREGRFVETFKVDSWIEHLRQHERVTHADREVQESVNRFEINGAPKVTHLIACA